MRGTSTIVWLSVATLLVSGCTSGTSGATSSGTTSAPAPTVSSDTGSITGEVFTDEFQPIPGTEVAINGPATSSAMTDAEGKFTFNELPPGSYVVFAQRLGFQSASKKAAVTAGAATEVSFSLEAVAIDEDPRMEYVQTDGFITGPDVYCFCVIVYRTYSFTLNLTPGAQDIVTSMAWLANAPTTARYLYLGLYYKETRNGTFGASPVTTRIEELELSKKDKATVFYSIYFACQGATFTPQCLADHPDALVPVIAYEQRVKLYSSIFYHQPAPDGYTGLPE
ncbi:MAG: carboxypeptidase regulatory-like domain-containing protein [Euryarchaeota archaeon]|nr:carboxypeptidase regulatory-like domain-containing protein [Euryarchaeota archaeon]